MLLMAGLLRDVAYGVRVLRRQPGIAAMAIVTMAVGIGATTILFSVTYGVLLKPLPWPGAERLVRVTETRQNRGGRVAGTVSNGTFLAWRDKPATIEDIGGWLTQTATMSGAGDPVRMSVVPTTPGLFAILRARPLIGRLFAEGEGERNQPGLVILSYGLWQERFGARPQVVGEVARFDDKPYTIVGVMPPDFAFPDHETRAWTAWSVPPVTGQGGALVGVIFRSVARLRDHATPAQAAAEATARARTGPDMGLAARALFGAAGPIDVSAVAELDAITGDVRFAILVVFAAVGLLFATATANVAGIQLARATTRRREIALRTMIGAGGPQIIRQLLAENLIVAFTGGAGGLLLASSLARWLPSLLPAGFPRLQAIAIDQSAFAFTVLASLSAGVACGLLPAWHARRLNLVESLVDAGGSTAGAMRSPMAHTRALVMAAQVAVACILLVGAGLLARSFVQLTRADRGYDPVNVLTARLPLPPAYPVESRGQLLETLTDRLRSVPGVTHAAFSTALPFVSFGGFTAFKMRSPRQPDQQLDVQATQRIVSPDYFGAMRLRLVAGRALLLSDTATTTPAIVVNQSFAQQYLGDRAVGTRIPRPGPSAGALRFANDTADWEVVGIVDDMRQDGVDAARQPEVFASFAQLQPAALRSFDPILVVRTTSDPARYVSALRGIVAEQPAALALDSVMTMEDRVMESLARPRLFAVVLVLFGSMALLIAGVGVFGLVSFSVSQRTREIAVRSALGAQARDIVALVLRQVFWIVGAGVSVGVALALPGVRVLSTFLYGVDAHDVPTFIAVPLAVALLAMAACVVPLRRAATMDPLVALRQS